MSRSRDGSPVVPSPQYRRPSLDAEYHQPDINSSPGASGERTSSTSPWAPALDSIVDEYTWEPENGPSAWDPKLDPARGRESFIAVVSFLC